MIKAFAFALFVSSLAGSALAQEGCYSEKAVNSIVKRYKLKSARCYWNSETATSDEDIQCVKTWVAPDKSYLSAELKSGCFDLTRHTAAQMRKLYNVKKPESEPEGNAEAVQSTPDPTLFANYPVAEIYDGKARAPDFGDDTRKLALSSSDIADYVKHGVQFAGEYGVIQIGCGTGCTNVIVASVKTGKVVAFPRGGENNQGLQLEFKTYSRQMLVRWYTDSTWKACVFETFLLDDGHWTAKLLLSSKNKDACESRDVWFGLLTARGR